MRVPKWLLPTVVFAIFTGIAAGATIAARGLWLPLLTAKEGDSKDEASHAGHNHAKEGDHADEDQNSVPLSEQARANLGLTLGTVQLSDYTKNLVIPGVVVEQPGHSERRITTPVAGVVVKVHAFPGQAVRPGDPLLDVQPTGEVLTTTQADLLRTIQELALADLEIKRLTPLTENGAVSRRLLLEKEYERKRLESQKLVQIQELLVRGLTAYQVTEIVEHKTLLREFTIYVPGGKPKSVSTEDEHDHPSVVPTGLSQSTVRSDSGTDDLVYTIERIDIFPGKLVQPGDELCDLGLHTELYLEGHAFERDSRLVARMMQEQRPLTALFESESETPETRDGLFIRYVDSALDPTSRTLRFFVPLKNEVIRDAKADNGIVYRSWRFKPGQKVRLLLPEQQLSEQIVLPAAAVVSEGSDAYVFRANGELMERVPVVIEHRDPRLVVLRNDGSVFPGDELAMNQTYQINLALKKQQGSGVDPHAGHNH
jgi:multidrug efflux pump subunit AcrA (membrane-fusion protein)